uniref:ras-related protein Rab-44 n=1 Tax=Centroberyx gerrardi TaxID=166262 RepID=UPI003AAF55E1
MSEEAHNIKIEIKNESEVSNPANRRKKMGSTRRNLRPKGEELHRKQEADNEKSEIAKNVGDAIMAESESSIKTLQLQMEHKDGDSEKEREKIFETMKECSHQSVLGIEENPETERHLTPSCLPSKSATFPEHDLLSESKSGGRRRKMGSNRKSRGHQHHEDPTECEDKITDAGDGRDLKSKTEESAIGTFEEVVTSYDKSGQKPSSSSSISSTGDPSRPVGVLSQRASEQETPNQLPGPEDHLVQAREKTHSLGFSKEGDLRPNCYNVVMVGNSNVGKTSFMKRVQSGMFSLDFCASVGIDTCMQSVRVDGKTVVLQLWDTAGQERFHSITRQVFHKAQAILLMYDVTSFQSFSDVRYWVSCIQEGAVENVIIILLGNKSDCAERQVQSHQGEVLAKDYNIDFMECSAATGENVMQSLETVARMLCQKSDTKEEGMVLRKEPQQRKKSGCC